MAENDPPRGDTRPRSATPSGAGGGSETGWAVTGTLISGMAVWGGAGWLLDRWLDVKVFLPVGVILGVAVAIYVVVVKYGGADPTLGLRRKGSTSGGTSDDQGGTRTQKGQR